MAGGVCSGRSSSASGCSVKFGKFALLFAGKLKLLTTSGSMLVSVAAYSLIWGWKFAVGFVLLLFVHEMGHVIQLRREGVEASAPMFIPFLGAVVCGKSLGDDAAAEARVGLAGPVLGTLGAAALHRRLRVADRQRPLPALAFTGFFLNLFNLLPIVPLDGGRAMAAMSPWMWFVGFFAIVGFAFAFPNPIIILIAAPRRAGDLPPLEGAALGRRGGARVLPRHAADSGCWSRVVYLGLIAVLVLGMDATHLTARSTTSADRRAATPLAVRLAQRALHVALHLALLDRLALVEAVLAAGQRDLDLRARPSLK